MSIKKIWIATSNEGKRVEFSRILRVELESVKLAIDEIQALDPETVCYHKAALAFEKSKKSVLVDDTALGLTALAGFPGALVTWVLESGGPSLLHRMLPLGAPTSAVATTVVGLADEDGVHLFRGSTLGSVVDTPRGDQGFGFDSVFVPDGSTKTLAELSSAEKDEISPRRLALDKLRSYLSRI